MNSRERVLAAMRRRQPDRVPFDFTLGFSPQQLSAFKSRTGLDDPSEFFGADCRGFGVAESRRRVDHSAYHPYLPKGATIDEWGIGHLPTASKDAVHEHLEGFLYPMLELDTADDAYSYPLPDIDAGYRYEHLAPEVARAQERGLAAIGHMACTIFEVAWYMRSMERLLMDFIEGSDFAAVLLDRITAKRCEQARWMTGSGVDILLLGDDIASQRGMMMGVPMWRTWLKPRLAQVIDAARKVQPDVLIFYHSDGNATAIVEDLIEIGVDILNPIQPECMDPAALKTEYGDRLSFWGTVGTQSTFPFGSPDDVRREIEHRIDIVGAGGGLLIAPSHMVEPEVPWENIVALVETCKNYGGIK